MTILFLLAALASLSLSLILFKKVRQLERRLAVQSNTLNLVLGRKVEDARRPESPSRRPMLERTPDIVLG